MRSIMIPYAFLGKEERVIQAYPFFTSRFDLNPTWFFKILILRMQERPEEFGKLKDEASFVAGQVEEVREQFVLLKEDAIPESIREKLVLLSQEFWGHALFLKDHCFERIPDREAVLR